MAGRRRGGGGWRSPATAVTAAVAAATALAGCSGGSGVAVGAAPSASVSAAPSTSVSAAPATSGPGTSTPSGHPALPAALRSTANPVLLLSVGSGARTVTARPATVQKLAEGEGVDLRATGPAHTFPVAPGARVFVCGPLWGEPLPAGGQEVEEYTWARFTALLARHGVDGGMEFYTELDAQGRITLLHQHYHP